MNIAVAGLGLIGGSFAKAIKSKTDHKVTGFDISEEALNKALDTGAIDSAEKTNISDADLILIALYPTACVEFVRENAVNFKKGAVIVDLCGVKRFVCTEINAAIAGQDIVFIGGHPMAGRELSGFDNSLPELFENASMILTPDNNTDEKILKSVEAFFLSLGFKRITLTSPEHHDEMIAFTSQLAHIVSSAYVQSPIASEFMGFSAGSFGDMTRVAKLNEDMWTELFMLNRDFLTQQLDVIISNLSEFREYISIGERENLHEMLKNGRIIKEIFNSKN